MVFAYITPILAVFGFLAFITLFIVWWGKEANFRHIDFTRRKHKDVKLKQKDDFKSMYDDDGANRSWGDLLNRTDVLIIHIVATGLSESAKIKEVAVIDTTGKTRYHEDDFKFFDISHEDLLAVLRTAELVIGWYVAFDKRMLQQFAEGHDSKPVLPQVCWHDVMFEYGDGCRSLMDVVEHKKVPLPGYADRYRGLHDCYLILEVMKAVVGGGDSHSRYVS